MQPAPSNGKVRGAVTFRFKIYNTPVLLSGSSPILLIFLVKDYNSLSFLMIFDAYAFIISLL